MWALDRPHNIVSVVTATISFHISTKLKKKKKEITATQFQYKKRLSWKANWIVPYEIF